RVNVARVATSTATTMTSSALDLVRRQVARLDVLLASFVRRVFRRRAPTALVPGETVLYPAGAFTRLLAYVVDTLAISALLAGAVSLFTYLADLFLTNDLHPTRGAGEWWGVVAAAVTFGYFWLSVAATGRTPGKALLGLRVVRRNGDAVGGRAAFVRALVFPFSFVLGLGFVGVVGGRSRRALHDVAAGTVVVYDRETAAPMSSAKLPE
ncbi:MAG TPA: RDD family protein, partial [Acidimicrobiales bacterium]